MKREKGKLKRVPQHFKTAAPTSTAGILPADAETTSRRLRKTCQDTHQRAPKAEAPD